MPLVPTMYYVDAGSGFTGMVDFVYVELASPAAIFVWFLHDGCDGDVTALLMFSTAKMSLFRLTMKENVLLMVGDQFHVHLKLKNY